MSTVSMREMLEAGVHFGHQTRFWNPKMSQYIFGHRNKIHIINLEATVANMNDALGFIRKLSSRRGTVLFVGTKRASREIIHEEATRAGMPYVDQRWLGGMLTNFKTVKTSIKRLKEMEATVEEGGLERMSKKEGLRFERELEKLDKGLGGIKDMNGLPDAIFVVDVGYHKIAIQEANKLGWRCRHQPFPRGHRLRYSWQRRCKSCGPSLCTGLGRCHSAGSYRGCVGSCTDHSRVRGIR